MKRILIFCMTLFFASSIWASCSRLVFLPLPVAVEKPPEVPQKSRLFYCDTSETKCILIDTIIDGSYSSHFRVYTTNDAQKTWKYTYYDSSLILQLSAINCDKTMNSCAAVGSDTTVGGRRPYYHALALGTYDGGETWYITTVAGDYSEAKTITIENCINGNIYVNISGKEFDHTFVSESIDGGKCWIKQI